MVDVYSDPDEREETTTKVALDQAAAPDPVGVYERPERSLAGMPMILGIIIFALIALAALYIIF